MFHARLTVHGIGDGLDERTPCARATMIFGSGLSGIDLLCLDYAVRRRHCSDIDLHPTAYRECCIVTFALQDGRITVLSPGLAALRSELPRT